MLRDECVLCEGSDEVLWTGERCRVVLADEEQFPGFCRVIWNEHVAEMTDLGQQDRDHVMHVVYAVEAVLREQLQPDKINLAALGNMVPHIHWHVVPRWADDATFPGSPWSPVQREPAARTVDVAALRDAISAALS